MTRNTALALLAGALLTTLFACTTMSSPQQPAHPQSAESAQRQGEDLTAMPKGGLRQRLGVLYRFLFDKPANTQPAEPVPVRTLTRQQLLDAPDNTVYRLGHSTVLLKLRGAFFLTDPVFSERASPVQWAGPKRFHAPPIAIADLPPIQAVILSHDHYDHLDHAAIRQLADRVEHFVTPLGVGDRLIEWGVDAARVQQLDWWQSTEVAGVQLVATPAQHFSGRSLSDGNRTLWASWALLSPEVRVFFSGDTGYFDGFQRIGERYGPFDLTLMETGAYDENWAKVHMFPEQTLQAHIDLRGRWLLPVHNGTFDLAMHAWTDPLERIVALGATHGVDVTTPHMGEPVQITAMNRGSLWWSTVQTAAPARGPRVTPVAWAQPTER